MLQGSLGGCLSVATVAPLVLLVALALWLPCVALHPASCHGVWGSPEHCVGSSGLPCSTHFCASPGPLGGELLGQGREPGRSHLSGTRAGDVLTPREHLTGSLIHLGG